MDNEYIIIYIDDIPYYLHAGRMRDLAYINNKLVNISSSSITLVNNFDTQTSYPRITCASMQQCIYRNSYSSTGVGVTSPIDYRDKFNMNILNNINYLTLIFALLFVLLGVKLIWKK